MTFDLNDLSCLGALALIVFILSAWVIGMTAFRFGFDAGHIAGGNEERSHTNSRMIPAKMNALHQGIRYGVENHEALRIAHSERREP